MGAHHISSFSTEFVAVVVVDTLLPLVVLVVVDGGMGRDIRTHADKRNHPTEQNAILVVWTKWSSGRRNTILRFSD
jgi:hypothetical protein